MAWYPDLSLCTYFDRPGAPTSKLVAVGWLSERHPVPGGAFAPDDRAALEALLVRPWDPFQLLGSHECDLCPPKDPFVEGANLFVPALDRDAVYAASAMIGHYVAAHGYVPPAPFVEAVRACPPLRSTDYLLAMARHRPADLRWCTGLLDAVPLDGVPPAELAPFLVDAARRRLVDLDRTVVRNERQLHRPRDVWVGKLGPLVAHAARALEAAGSPACAALEDLERARAALPEEPYSSAIAAAIAAIRAG